MIGLYGEISMYDIIDHVLEAVNEDSLEENMSRMLSEDIEEIEWAVD